MHQLQISKYKKKIVHVLKKNGVSRASLFGSFARNEAKKNSDIDLLIEFKGKKSLLDLSGLKIELEESTGRHFDLLTYNSIHPLLKERILEEQIPIL